MYKIIYNQTVIDVVSRPTFIKFLKNGNITVTDKSSAEGIVGSDNTPYSFYANTKYKSVVIKEIDQEEFSRLLSLLNSGQEVSADEAELAKAKKDKLATLSAICKNKIISGFSVRLSDGTSNSFKLTIEDQINLMVIENQLLSGETSFVYHATNEPCKIFTRDDIKKIIDAYKKHTLYHTTYFNAAKQYVNSLTSIDKVRLFHYGDDVSASIDNEVLRGIIKSGGSHS